VSFVRVCFNLQIEGCDHLYFNL